MVNLSSSRRVCKSELKDRELPRFIRDLLSAPPARGAGLNQWFFRAARVLHPYRDPEEIISVLRAATIGAHLQPGEIERAVENSAAVAWQPGRPSHSTSLPKWPPVNVRLVQSVIGSGSGLADLYEQSPLQFCDNKPHTEEVIDRLFPCDSLICCASSKVKFATRPRESLRGKLSKFQLIVPNPMISRTGRTLDGRLSEHSLANTGKRRFLVIEFDPAKWADLRPVERAEHGSEDRYYTAKRDEQAAILLYLAQQAPLALAVNSGGKSIHGWFFCEGCDESLLRQFMATAIALGADRTGWTRSQFVRMPDGTRDNGARQAVIFFHPEVVI